MTDKLSLFNSALLECGETLLSALTDRQESRFLLDHVYASGAINYCLERGQWNFATRTVLLDYDSGVEPTFGLNRAFAQPIDYCCTRAVCSDEFFRDPLKSHQYTHEGNYFYADVDQLYLRYVSNDPLYGMNLNQWPPTFERVVSVHLGSLIVKKLAGSEEQKKMMEDLREKLLCEAKNSNAQRDGTQMPTPGAWVRSRRAGWRGDGGNLSGDLIG